MNVERLRDMVSVLRSPLPGRFRIGYWADNLRDCGFAGCAVGNYCKARPDSALKIRDDVPQLGGLDNWDAVEEFFSLNHDEATWLFEGCAYPDKYETTATQVANRIGEFITCGGIFNY